MPSLLGSKPNQVSTNGDLGTLAFQDSNAVNITGGTVTTTSTTIGTASANPLTINSSAVSIPNGLNFDSNTLVIDASNNRVGIGTASPSFALDISVASATAYSATASEPAFRITNINSSAATNFSSMQLVTDGNGRGIVNLNALNNAAAASADFSIQTRHNGTLGERLRITSTGNLGIGTSSPSTFGRFTIDGVGIAGTPSSTITFRQAGTDVLYVGPIARDNNTDVELWNPRNGYIRFATNNAERMRLDSSGNLGIGTSSPYNPNGTNLEIYGSSNDARLVLNAVSGSRFSISSLAYGTALRFTNITTVSEMARFDNSGNFGIGTTSPGVKLDVSGAVRSFVSGGTPIVYLSNGTTQHSIQNTSGAFTFFNDGTERMRITSTGNVGIGTSSPTTKLDVLGSGDSEVRIRATSDASLIFSETTANKNWKLKPSAGDFYWQYSATAYNSGYSALMSLTSSGNLGLGVTPSAWSGQKSITFGVGRGFVSSSDTAFRFFAGYNAYNDGTWKYSASTTAALYAQFDSAHAWYTAPSGTAGNAITFTQAMTLTDIGRLGLGITSPAVNLHVYGATNADQYWDAGGTVRGYAQANTSNANFSFGTTTNHPTVFLTNGTEKMRIASGGQVGINQTPTTRQFSVTQNLATNFAAEFTQLSATGYAVTASCASSDTTGIYYSGYSSSAGATRFVVYSNGNVVNQNNSYGAISDIKLKENITDATPKLEKLNQVRVVNYNLIGEEQKQLGVIAQELEQIFPSMIDESPDVDRDGNDLGTTTKQVKYSVFVPMLIKAIQEQQAIITDLKARIETLESK